MPLLDPRSQRASATEAKYKCGAIINHFVDGKPQSQCTGCADLKSRTKNALSAKRVVPKVLSDEVKGVIRQIDDLLMNGYGWAEETLSGIRENIMKTGHVTDRQYGAIQNIEEAGEQRNG